MPVELRHIVFTPSEAIEAVRSYHRARGRALPQGEIKEAAGVQEAGGGAVGFRLLVETKAPPGAEARTLLLDVGLAGADLAAALIVYCKERGIPIPTNASKTLQCFGPEIGLTTTVNTHNAPLLERLRSRAGSLQPKDDAATGGTRAFLPPARRLIAALEARGETVALCETTTAGLLAAALHATPGGAAACQGGTVLFAGQAGRDVLALTDKELAWMRASPEAYARLLARKTRERFGARWGIAETRGYQRPATRPAGGKAEEKPDPVWVAVSGPVEAARPLELAGLPAGQGLRGLVELILEALPAPIAAAGTAEGCADWLLAGAEGAETRPA